MSYSTVRRGLSLFVIGLLIATSAIAKPKPEIQPVTITIASSEKPSEPLKPFDVATLALGAATVVLTGVGVIVAIAAVWGYNEIRNKSLETAEKAASAVATKVAKDTAEVVAARTVADWLKSRETTEEKEQTNELVDEAVGNPKNI